MATRSAPEHSKANPWRYTPEPVTVSIPTPTYSRNYSEIEKRIKAEILAAGKIIQKLKGHA